MPSSRPDSRVRPEGCGASPSRPWAKESNYLVGKLIKDLLDYCWPAEGEPESDPLFAECQRIAGRLLQGAPVEALEAITPEGTEPAFEVVARAVRQSIENNEPETGLDRLHTFVTKLSRTLAEKRGIWSTERSRFTVSLASM